MGLKIEIPAGIAKSIKLPESEVEERIRKELAVRLYEKGLLGFRKARELAGMARWEFHELLAKEKAVRRYDLEELEKDEVKSLKNILKKAEAIRLGIAEPKELEKVAVDAITKFGLKNLSEEVAEILHDCIDFAEQPFIGGLKDMENRAREALAKKL